MNKKDFTNKIVGTPWVDRAYGFDGCDCFGLVYLYLLEVENKTPSLTGEYVDGSSFSEAFNAQLETGEWVKLESPEEGAIIFMMYAGDLPVHCGIMLNRVDCLHSFGCDGIGQVVVWKMAQVMRHLSRFYKLNEKPRVEFYKWVA